MSLPKGNLNKPTGALINLMNELNNFTDDEKENELKLPNCIYREIYYFQKLSKQELQKEDIVLFSYECMFTYQKL